MGFPLDPPQQLPEGDSMNKDQENLALGWFAESGEYSSADLEQFKDMDFGGKVIMTTNRDEAAK
jgi:hypothetical protein